MFSRLFCVILLLILCFESKTFARNAFYTPDVSLDHKNKKRITEILRKENLKIVEDFYYVSNRPTIQEGLAEQIRNHQLISPENHMVYCPPGKDYYTYESLGTGSVHIGAPNLPKNGHETQRWFMSAYNYRTPTDPNINVSNVVIVSPKRRNFLRVKCPLTHNHIIVAGTAAPYSSDEPLKIVDNVANPRLSAREEKTFKLDDYNLPSKIKNDYFQAAQPEADKKNTVLKLRPPRGSVVSGRENNLVTLAQRAAKAEGIFVKLLLSIAEVGSKYNPNYRDREHYGIMVIPRKVAGTYNMSAESFFDPEIGFKIGAKYFRRVYEMLGGDLDASLRAYYLGASTPEDLEKLENYGAENFAKSVRSYLDAGQAVVFDKNR